MPTLSSIGAGSTVTLSGETFSVTDEPTTYPGPIHDVPALDHGTAEPVHLVLSDSDLERITVTPPSRVLAMARLVINKQEPGQTFSEVLRLALNYAATAHRNSLDSRHRSTSRDWARVVMVLCEARQALATRSHVAGHVNAYRILNPELTTAQALDFYRQYTR